MTICGLVAVKARSSAAESNTSTMAGSAPSARTTAALSRVVATIVWPAARNNGTSLRPITPLAPARNNFTSLPHSISDDKLAAGRGGELPPDLAATQFELQHNRRVVAAEIGMPAVRGEAEAHRRLWRFEASDLLERIGVVNRGEIIDMRGHANIAAIR